MYILHKQRLILIFLKSNRKQNGKQWMILSLPTNITAKFLLPYIYHLHQHIFMYLHVRKQLQVSFYKNMIYLSPSLYQGWKISTIRSEKTILYTYCWWKREKRIAYLSKILSLEVESNQVSFLSWQLKRWNGMCGFMARNILPSIGSPLFKFQNMHLQS